MLRSIRKERRGEGETAAVGEECKKRNVLNLVSILSQLVFSRGPIMMVCKTYSFEEEVEHWKLLLGLSSIELSDVVR